VVRSKGLYGGPKRKQRYGTKFYAARRFVRQDRECWEAIRPPKDDAFRRLHTAMAACQRMADREQAG